MLPNLSALSIADHVAVGVVVVASSSSSSSSTDPNKPKNKNNTQTWWTKWLHACTSTESRLPPDFTGWKRVRGNDKRRFYKLINDSENDKFSAGQYNTPYLNKDIDYILSTRRWSIEHVLPRSFVNGRRPGSAENDWLGWDVADRGANSSRSNLPLVLWPTPGLKQGRVTINGVKHYNPTEEHKARLARKWVFLRASYAFIDVLSPPSEAQKAHAHDIFEHIKRTRVGYAENRFQFKLEESVENMFGQRWINPLYDGENAHMFLDSDDFVDLVFGLV